MVFAEMAIHSGGEFSERFFCELMLFSKSLNLRICFLGADGHLLELLVCVLEKVHNEAKTLVNKTGKVTDIFRDPVQLFLSLRLSGLQPVHPCIKAGLLLYGKLYVSFKFFVIHK